jgi:hypothetical protein
LVLQDTPEVILKLLFSKAKNSTNLFFHLELTIYYAQMVLLGQMAKQKELFKQSKVALEHWSNKKNITQSGTNTFIFSLLITIQSVKDAQALNNNILILQLKYHIS